MPRTLTASMDAWRQGRFVAYDWLVESQTLDIHWAYRETTAGGHTWAHQLLSISEIEVSVPPGGGLASVNTLTVQVAEGNTGRSIRRVWDDLHQVEGADLTVALLPQGEAYANRLIVFTGVIDHASWRAGVGPGDGIGTLIAVDTTLHSDIQIPSTILTPDTYPNLPVQWQGAILPLIYGSSTILGAVPALLVDPLTLTYLVADHAMGSMGTVHAVPVAQGTRLLSYAGGATTDATQASLVLTMPVTEFRYGVGNFTQVLTHTVNVTNAANFIDNNAASVAVIGTGTLNADGEGWGRLAVKYVWENPDGANTAILTLFNHRRTPGAATTVTAELIVRSIHPATNAVQRDNLFRDGPYRHQSAPRSRAVTVAPLAVVQPAALEVELQVLNEGGAGSAAETWTAGEVTILLYFQADTLFYPVYLFAPWEGRADTDGMITGGLNITIRQAAAVLHSLLVQRLGLTIDSGAFTTVKATLVNWQNNPWTFDFGLGAGGWYRPQMLASELLDRLSVQAKCYLFPRGDGSIAINEVRSAPPSQLELTISNMWNVEIELGRLEQIHSTYEVRYRWSTTLGRFTAVAYAAPGGSNHSNATTASDLQSKCSDSVDRYGPQTPLIIEAFAINDQPTAETLLQHLVDYFWTQLVTVHLETTFVGIHLEVGDYVTITHPELPASANGGLFEVVRVTILPEQADSRPLPIRLTCLAGGTLPTFDYFLIKDQADVTWYWWIDPANTLAWALVAPSLTTRIATNLTILPIPSWLQLGGGGGGETGVLGFRSPLWILGISAGAAAPSTPTRYVYPSTLTGEPTVATTLPAVGTGYVGSPSLRGQGTGIWAIGVSETDEVTTIPSS